MIYFKIIILILYIHFILGLVSKQKIDDLTKVKNDERLYTSTILLKKFLMVGIFGFLFLKRIRRYRLIEWYEWRKKNCEYFINEMNIFPNNEYIKKKKEELLYLNRILKIEKLKNK